MAKIFTGTVTSDKMMKTVVVNVERTFQHPTYRKIITRRKKIKAHNEKLELKIGDVVRIKETRPISKDKYFEVVEKVEKKS